MEFPVENGFVKIPQKQFSEMMAELRELREDAADIAAADRALRQDEEAFPLSVARDLVEGEATLRVFRKYRGLTQAELAKQVGVSKTTISEIESGRKHGSVPTLSAIADALDVAMDDLI